MFTDLNNKITQLTKENDKRKSLDHAIDVANEFLRILDPSIQNLRSGEDVLDDAIPVNQFPNQKVENWFMNHPYFTGDKVALRFFTTDNLETKFYWLSDNATKSRVSAGVMLTPNWEDSELTKNDNYKVGLDFFLTANAQSLLVAISNNGNLRIIELSDRLTHTQVEILQKLRGTIQLSTKEQIHRTLWDALALNEVNKKFYSGVAEQFNILLNHLVKEGREKEDSKLFSSRILGRLLFLWFLRKKNLIDESFGYFELNSNDSSEYYETKLKPLFFSTLNTPIEDRDGDDDKTPYLNGGLFEAHDNDWANETISFPVGFFNGLYEHLEKYNFTTDESSPEYEQVAIDPEMLGRVFESLLATQSTETGEQARKAKGAFYTPREIVSYMCKESLRNYLYTCLDNEALNEGIDKLIDLNDSDWEIGHSNSKRNLWGESNLSTVPRLVISALDNLKVLDPACGSGAFPMGMLQLVLRTYERLDPRFDPHRTKLQIVQNNIFGVDIEPMAVEISRLRAWLSLIVDENSRLDVEPLPNLDFKFVCANSLIPLDRNNDLFNDPELHSQLADIRKSYFNARKPHTKKSAQDKYYKITRANDGFFDNLRTRQLKSFDPFINSHPAEFFDEDVIFGITDGFDIVIGNPPYVSVWNIDPLQKVKYEKLYTTATGHYDLYVIFYELGVRLTKKGGVLSYITSNKWMAQSYGKKLRELFLKIKLLVLVDFSAHQVFDSATVDTQITILKNVPMLEDYSLKIYKHLSKTKPEMTSLNYLNLNTSVFRLNDELNFKINLTLDTLKLISKINSTSISLDQILYISKGAELHNTNKKTKKEIFIKDEYQDGLKNYIEGKYFAKYKVLQTKYLDYQPLEHKAPVFPELFESKKIIVKNVVGRGGIQAFLDDSKYYNNDAIINAVPYYELEDLNYRQVRSQINSEVVKNSRNHPLEFCLGVLNSNISNWYFSEVFSNGLHFYPRHLKSIRIPVINETNKALVDRVVVIVQRINNKPVEDKEYAKCLNDLDNILYEIYGLNTEEIEIVEKHKH